MGLSSLGQSIIKKVANKKIRISSNLDSMISQFEKSCPSEKDLIKIIKQRNKLVLVLTQLKRNILKLDNATKPLKPLLSSLNKASKLLKLSPIPLAVGAPAIALPLGTVMTAGNSLNLLNQKSTGIISTIAAFTQIKKYILKTIEDLLNKTKTLDSLVTKCVDKKSSPSPTATTTTPGLSLNSLIDVSSISDSNLQDNLNTILNNEESNLINNLQSSSENQDNTYNGFVFEILIDTNNTTRFIKRYAVAKTQSGVILLRGESSFSSSIEVLIDELKFIIDRDNLKAF